jgi:hypothetical protein
MLIPLAINVGFSICAFFGAQGLIPNLKEMFLKANISGIDLNKKDKQKM